MSLQAPLVPGHVRSTRACPASPSGQSSCGPRHFRHTDTCDKKSCCKESRGTSSVPTLSFARCCRALRAHRE
eukprot:2686110-Pyramimonas_sp.AAC.1